MIIPRTIRCDVAAGIVDSNESIEWRGPGWYGCCTRCSSDGEQFTVNYLVGHDPDEDVDQVAYAHKLGNPEWISDPPHHLMMVHDHTGEALPAAPAPAQQQDPFHPQRRTVTTTRESPRAEAKRRELARKAARKGKQALQSN